MTESAVLKAKEKALARLRDACLNGELGVWREVRKMMRAASRGEKASLSISDTCSVSPE